MDGLKGIILAGGTGSRLGNLTSVINKHLVAVGEKPMIEYPLATLKRMNIEDITVVTGAEHAGSIMNYLTNVHPEIDFTYKVQKKAGGIADAISLTKNVIDGSRTAIILGDNIFDGDFSEDAKDFIKYIGGCKLFLKEVDDAERFGVAEIKDDKIINIEEKPENPKSNLAVTGLYLFDNTVFDKISRLTPSKRGELEVSDLINLYVKEEKAYFSKIPGFWSDAGTHESRRKAEDYVYSVGFDHFKF